jgi:hypothetical protein
MPWSDWDEGMVHKVAKLGKGVMVYGNGGRAALVPYSTQLATGFGLKPLAGPGISKGFHMAGDEHLHGFIDTNNEFWVVDANLEFQKLGYKEFIDDMQAENDVEAADLPIIVSYNRYDKRFHISGVSSACILTEFGLYSCHQSSTGIGRYRGSVLSGFQKDLGDYEGRISVDKIDFNVRGLKTLDVLEFGADYKPSGSYIPYGGVDFKYTHSDAFRSSDWIRLNNEGIVHPIVTANDFRVKFKVDDYRDGDPKLDSIKLRWKLVDKRAVRGPYAG